MPRLRKRKRKMVKVKIEPAASAGSGSGGDGGGGSAGAGAGAVVGAGAGRGSVRSEEPERKRRRLGDVKVKREGKVKKEKGVKKEGKQEHGVSDGADGEEEEEEEEEMMFDFGRERRRVRGKGGAGRKKKVGPVRRSKGGKIKVLGRYAHIDDAKAFMRGLRLKGQKAFHKWRKTAARPVEIPSNSDTTYKDCGWKGYADFLGNPNTGVRKMMNGNWRSLEAATTYVQALGLKSHEAWNEWRKSGTRPEDIPALPCRVYKKRGE